MAAATYFGTESGFHVWWAIAFRVRFARQLAEGQDLTSIPGYDTLAQELSWEFGEFADDGGAERLWDLLLSPHDPMPCVEQIERQALELLASGQLETLETIPPELDSF